MRKDTPNTNENNPSVSTGGTSAGAPNPNAGPNAGPNPSTGVPTVDPNEPRVYPQSAFTYPPAEPTEQHTDSSRPSGKRIALMSVAGVALAAVLFGGGFWAGTVVDDGPGMSHSRSDDGPGMGEWRGQGGPGDDGREGGPGDSSHVRPDDLDRDEISPDRTGPGETTPEDDDSTPETDEGSDPADTEPANPSLYVR